MPETRASFDCAWTKEKPMNWDRIKGNWKQAAGKFQERYGVAKDEAEKQLTAWQAKADDSWFS
jgi:hypothetical protein